MRSIDFTHFINLVVCKRKLFHNILVGYICLIYICYIKTKQSNIINLISYYYENYLYSTLQF